jgi:hypothetical protein
MEEFDMFVFEKVEKGEAQPFVGTHVYLNAN